jgi:hypothetical protein
MTPGACTPDKYLPVDPACTVKWSTDIYPKMKSGAAWNCGGTGCHAPGGVAPVINDNPDETYANLVKHITSGKPYFNPCSKDVNASSFACNTRATGTCASAMPPGNGVPEADKAPINTWVACGSPKN